jgi:UDP-2,4-diacetamido-2,4,6-trideoxy-beta-L-altropyranose hydrolase
MMTAPIALFRCDASPTIGGGHVTRCMALAEALAEAGWRIGFAVRGETGTTVPALGASGFKVDVLADTDREPDALREKTSGHVDLLVVDHYQRNKAFERACRSFARKILVLDDATGRDHDCDVLIDAAATSVELYAQRVPAHAVVLAGPAYALMRKSFLLRRDEALARRDGRPVGEVLISFGATDPTNVTAIALTALDRFADAIPITVALSSRAPYIDDVRQKLRGKARLALDAEMAELMTRADLAIGAAGVSSYERALLGLPSILVITADNQRDLFRMLVDGGAGVDGGKLDGESVLRIGTLTEAMLCDPAIRMRMTQKASRLVDGCGASRIVNCLADFCGGLVPPGNNA